MTRTRIHLFGMLLLIGLASCATLPTATIPPSPQPIKVSLAPFLEPVREALYTCAVSLPGFALIVEVVPQNAQEVKNSDLVIWWGEQPEEAAYAFQIAEEPLVVIVHADNLNTEMSTSELLSLFSGRITFWTDISILEDEVVVWVYPEGSYLSVFFNQVLLGGQNFSRLAYLAPSPGPMLEEVSEDPGAIGFIPRAWLSAEVTQVNIDPDSQAALIQPILALVNSEPRSGVRDLLTCLQTGEGQQILASEYTPQE